MPQDDYTRVDPRVWGVEEEQALRLIGEMVGSLKALLQV